MHGRARDRENIPMTSEQRWRMRRQVSRPEVWASRDRIDAPQWARAEAVRAAVDEERAGIATEPHDNVGVPAIQARPARETMDAEPARSERALLAIETGGLARVPW
jgi:hypothetical protein